MFLILNLGQLSICACVCVCVCVCVCARACVRARAHVSVVKTYSFITEKKRTVDDTERCIGSYGRRCSFF